MKKTFTLLVLLITFAGAAQAQILNASFENWTAATGYSTPDGWDNFNPLSASMSVYTCEKGTTGAPHGSSFLMLTTKVIGTSVVPGLAMLGKFDPATFKPKSGVPFTGRPSHLTGKWQYVAQGNDTGAAAVYLTKWNTTTNKRDFIAVVEYLLPGTAASWTSFAIPLEYEHGDAPDSVVIGFVSSNKTSYAAAGSYVYVDSLNFFGNVPNGITITSNLKYGIRLSPNPAKDNLSVDFGMTVTEDVRLQVIDIYGKLVTETMFDRGRQVYSMNLHNIAPGMYFVKANVGEDVQTLRLLVE